MLAAGPTVLLTALLGNRSHLRCSPWEAGWVKDKKVKDKSSQPERRRLCCAVDAGGVAGDERGCGGALPSSTARQSGGQMRLCRRVPAQVQHWMCGV